MPRKTHRRRRLAGDAGRRASMRPRPDAAENPQLGARPNIGHRCFNEAAARCRGKRASRRSTAAVPAAASVRPRPDAAENQLRDAPVAGGGGASMRPRPDAAEN